MDEIVRVGRYQVREVIGKGAMGVVYLAFDPQIDRRVALKTIRPHEGADPEEIASTRERFLREARSAGKLLHPNIVTVFDVFEDRATLYISMEYVEGDLLSVFCAKENLLPADRAVELVMQGLSALHFAHRHGVVHRDIKPANLMVVEEGQVLKVMDFGVARQGGSHLTQTGYVVGTPDYMSPEQIEGGPLDGRTDVFSMGVVLYELLTGERPFIGDNISSVIYHILNHSPAPPSTVDGKIPPGLDLVLQKALAKKPDQRFTSAEAFRNALAHLSKPEAGDSVVLLEETRQEGGSKSLLPPPPSSGSHRVKPKRLSRAFFVTLTVLSLAIAAGLYGAYRYILGPASKGAPTAPPLSSQDKLPLPVAVTTKPEGARLFLDDHPVEAVTLPRGDKTAHWVEARKGCLSARVRLTPGVTSLSMTLRPGPFSFPVSSEPPGASILVDGRDSGLVTPAEVPRNDCSPFKVTFVAKGRQRKTVAVDPRAKDSLEAALDTIPEKGSLRVHSGSATIRVYEGSRLLGRSGRTFTLPAGEHKLRFVDPVLRGVAVRTVTVEGGSTKRIRVPPFATGRVFLYGKPTSDGKVTVDGRYFEDLPLNGTVPLAVGRHRFKVVRPDGKAISFSWTVKKGDQTKVVDFDTGRVETP